MPQLETSVWLDPFMTNIDANESNLYLLAATNAGFNLYVADPREPLLLDSAGLYTHERNRDHSAFWREVERLKNGR